MPSCNPTTASAQLATFIFIVVHLLTGTEGTVVGVNYGAVADNLPTPSQVAQFLLQRTIIDHVKLFNYDPSILEAFAETGISVAIAIPNDEIPNLALPKNAQQWLQTNVIPYATNTIISHILVGNEVLSTGQEMFISSLLPSMQELHGALVDASLDQIKVSSPHSLNILSVSNPPSTGVFQELYAASILQPLLGFLRATNAPFMINPYPYFGFTTDTLNYALFEPNPGVLDINTNMEYTNMLDAQLDAVFSAMKKLGFEDVQIVIAETGWPSVGDSGQPGVDVANAATYNGNLIRHVTSGIGTPLMPQRTFDTYIFALFNEDLKPGPTTERNFGLFQPNLIPVYDIQILQQTVSISDCAHARVTNICLPQLPVVVFFTM